nr:RNA-directed DNA polymerase, eukaryota, reverse transcriptase zinc-binding domain protein [Tanacetum cinerariifolium]
MCKEFKQKEIKKFVEAKHVQVCAILEAHLKTKSINKACDWVFGNWRWVSNVYHSPTCCRMVIGWNSQHLDIMVVHSSRQAMLCLVESVDKRIKLFCSFFMLLIPILKEENSRTLLRDARNTLEVEDLCSSGFKFTWTKSLKNPFTATLKKLDKIMINEEFLQEYKTAHAIFLPYLTSDHSPSVLVVTKGFVMKNKSFRFMNFVADKTEFMDNVNDVWRKEIKGFIIGKQYTEAAEDELKILHQKAKIHWLKEGDGNFAYFYSVLKVRKHKSRVDSICKEDGRRVEGPDGYTSHFFKKAWSCIGEAVCVVVKDFFLNGKLLEEVNATLIALVPKIDTPNKALNLVGFHETMINWIMTCITTASFSICINEEVCGFFKGGRGLRQGVPISPYMFTIVMEVFNMIMIKNIAANPSFKYHYGCKEIKLTHMCFANDLMVMCNADKGSLEVVKKASEELSSVFGLFPNLSKSTIFFGSVREDRKRELLKVLPFKIGKLHMKYLGVPFIAKKLSLSDCKSLIDNVDARINTWRNKLLSYAGRIQIFASVLFAMHQYWASVYMLPTAVIKELDKLFKRFLWNFSKSAQGKARVS